MRVPVQPQMLQWAVDRSGRTDVRTRFDRFDEWLTGRVQPTLRQLQEFAHYTYSAVGYFFQAQPPQLNLPIPDFRTMAGSQPAEPSPDLLDTVYLCQQRQEWYARYARSMGEEPLTFLSTLRVENDVITAA